MSHADTASDRLVSLRRDLHRHPEPAWREFRTTSRIVDELEAIGVDELLVGSEFIDPATRMGVPEKAEIDRWYEAAREAGAREDVLDRTGGVTGALAVVRSGDGPTIGLRVDIDGLPRSESEAADHVPAAEGFRSETGAMHACGHDAHVTFGIGVVESIVNGEAFDGTLKVVFQPAEEVIGGGKAVAESGWFDDCDHLLAAHIGLDHPTGEVVAGIDGFLAVHHFEATFTGEPAHAGGQPNEGANAVQALAAAVENLYAIPRHEDGPTRVNAGVVEGGSAPNIIPEEAHLEGEVRGKTTELKEYMRERATRVSESAAEMHGCGVDIDAVGDAPSARSDDAVVDVVERVANGTSGVETVPRRDDLGGSEDATYIMQRVQDNGGTAAYVGIGTDHPGGHHTSTFDVDEPSLGIGVDVLTESVRRLAEDGGDVSDDAE